MSTPRRQEHSHHRLALARTGRIRPLSDSSPTLVPARPGDLLEAGEIVNGKFRIERRIGAGGMGVVYAGRHLELDQPIAIKFLLAEDAGRDVRRFLSEARAVARLDSPHVARVLDAGVMETRRGRVIPFLVMEHLRGCDLEALLSSRGRLPVVEAVEYLIQACSGAAEAHGAGIVHRDLKPANLFLTAQRDGTPRIKLLDFGIAKNVSPSVRHAGVSITGEGETVGSPLYMSPEQVRGEQHLDIRSDIWSLGIILHEMLTGTTAFAASTPADLFAKILQSEPRPLSEYAHEVPRALANVVTRCLKKERDARYASVEELAAALAPFRGPVPRFVPPPARQALEGAGDPDALTATLSRRAKRRPLRPGRIALGAVGVTLISVAMFVMFRAPADAPPATTALVATSIANAAAADGWLPPPLASTVGSGASEKLIAPEKPVAPTLPQPLPTRAKPAAKAAARPAPSNPPRQRTEW